jgi:hypothetical protein
MWLFGPLFDQATMHIAQGCGDHLLPSNTPKPMENLHMVHMTLNPFQECLLCSTHRSQMLKDYIWNQLWLRYIMKQIYDKHKVIWWARVNVGEPMIKDDFIKAQNIVYWDQSTRGVVGAYMRTQNFYIIVGMCSPKWCLLFPRCKWSEWDSNPLHHWDPNTKTVLGHAPIRS